MPGDRKSSRPWIGPVIGVVLVLTAVGGLVARSIYQPGSANSSTPPAAAPPPASGTTTTGSTDPHAVQLSLDAASSPYGKTIFDLLTAYYNAINTGSYVGWEGTATPGLIAANPEPYWDSGYKSVQDTGMYVYRINAAPGNQLRVLITFDSHQDVSKAPNDAKFACITWQSVLTIASTKLGWKIDNGTAGGHPIKSECATS
ncbi:MAG TPA: hypothetical protein VGN81_26330 [Pseudonocardiaceae bacterium]